MGPLGPGMANKENGTMLGAVLLMSSVCFFGVAEGVERFPVAGAEELRTAAGDWLVQGEVRPARIVRSADGRDLFLVNGLVARRFRMSPNAATAGLDDLRTGTSLLRAVKPEARVRVDGVDYAVGGLAGQPNNAYLSEAFLDALTAAPGALACIRVEELPVEARMGWNQMRHCAPGSVWPPKGAHLRFDYAPPEAAAPPFTVSVHYELYEGIPVFCKWITVHNSGTAPILLETFTNELLAVVEYGATVESRDMAVQTPHLFVETDYAFLGMGASDSSRHSVFWRADPEYATQVNYELKTPCLLETCPEFGPAETIAPGGDFVSFRTFIMPLDSYDRERNGLAQRRFYRTVAPWATENPLMLHVRYADRKTVFNAIDQCAETGFEMVILSFGSGFDAEDDSKSNLRKMTEYNEYARSKGIEIGGYSLLASRHIDEKNDVVMPEGKKPAFGASPCLLSEWGGAYFNTLTAFFEQSGFSLLEHDGSYPGDVCASTVHPGHAGLADSQWKQWRKITSFYHWCREKGIYLNVPDYYFLSGSNKTGMGYRETNWSLPRAQQVIHTRQNIFDGTWEKTPSMGWMFVPLTEYHGGGEAATIEPLDEHLDHYERMLVSNLACGVQACYRGPRLYDTDRTRDLVKKWVSWYKEYRDILESDLIHGRRADARDVDWMLHVNPALECKGMLVAFNPLNEPVTRTITVPLYYTGLTDKAEVRVEDKDARVVPLTRDYKVDVALNLPAEGFTWVLFK